MVVLKVHPLASVIYTVYVPADNPVAVALVFPPGAHEYVYGDVPPVTVAVALPLLKLQVAWVKVAVADKTGG
jgi:hypothetical protein